MPCSTGYGGTRYPNTATNQARWTIPASPETAVAVMTHARTQHHTADYTALTPDDQDRFDQAMERADDNPHNGEYLALMLAAAHIAGLRIDYGQHIRKCACSCYCPVIFNPDDPDAHCIEADGYNLGRHQCPLCADRHHETA